MSGVITAGAVIGGVVGGGVTGGVVGGVVGGVGLMPNIFHAVSSSFLVEYFGYFITSSHASLSTTFSS